MIENVRGILSSNNGYAKTRIEELLNNLGYEVNCNVLNASEYGVCMYQFNYVPPFQLKSVPPVPG